MPIIVARRAGADEDFVLDVVAEGQALIFASGPSLLVDGRSSSSGPRRWSAYAVRGPGPDRGKAGDGRIFVGLDGCEKVN